MWFFKSAQLWPNILKRKGKWNGSSAKLVLKSLEMSRSCYFQVIYVECTIQICIKSKQAVSRSHRNGLWYWWRRQRIFLSLQWLCWLHFAVHETLFVCSSEQPFTMCNFLFSVVVVLNHFERFNPLDKWKTKNLEWTRMQSALQKYNDKGTQTVKIHRPKFWKTLLFLQDSKNCW